MLVHPNLNFKVMFGERFECRVIRKRRNRCNLNNDIYPAIVDKFTQIFFNESQSRNVHYDLSFIDRISKYLNNLISTELHETYMYHLSR